MLLLIDALKINRYTSEKKEGRKANTTQLIWYKGQQQKLSTKEAELLQLLCLKKNNVLTREEALLSIWHDDNYFNGRSMDVFLSKLRKYLKEDPKVEILNVHGKGYKLLVN